MCFHNTVFVFHQIPLKTMWMGNPIKLLDFVGKCNVMFTGNQTCLFDDFVVLMVTVQVLFFENMVFSPISVCLGIYCKNATVAFRYTKIIGPRLSE